MSIVEETLVTDKSGKFAKLWMGCRKQFREDLNKIKHLISGIVQKVGGGAAFLALFQEVLFWSIKRVYFFKNANVLNF